MMVDIELPPETLAAIINANRPKVRILKHGHIERGPAAFRGTCPACGCEFEMDSSELFVNFGVGIAKCPEKGCARSGIECQPVPEQKKD